ncbi:MAG: ribosomal L7Ae/L30e/S12e/Gadd45 family protein [Candidatus Aenigmarchaeota archaeon]|nr:ribosomal L7Ae/L30e/S12e/Gadd45 family protein [Candidatus Aenigmarchaeota archaeon]
MTLTDDIQSAIKANKTIIGYNESLTYIKTNTPKVVIVANNLPLSIRQELEHNSKVSRAKFEVFDGTSRELGVVCGKPFPVTTIIIK